MTIKYCLAVLFLTVFSLITSSQEAIRSTESALEKGNDDSDLNAEQIIEMNKPSLISIWYHTDNYYSYYSYDVRDTTLLNGSGFFIDENGIIGTNYHVVDGIDSIIIKTSDGMFYDGELIIVDEANDMALIRIRDTQGKKFPTVRFGNSNNVKVRQDVYAIGNPFGYEYTISQGIIAGIREHEKVSFTDPVTYLPFEKKFEKVIQITAAISPGNSGGALFNSKGEVIGITTYTYGSYGNLNFALAINNFINFKNSIDLANFEKNEEAKRKRDENLFSTNFKLANNYKDQVTYNWYYTKQKDTMKVIDTFVVKQDSVVRINYYKAENFYNKCLQLEPDSFKVYQELMDLYVFTDSFIKAEILYDTIRSRFQSDSLLGLLSSSLASAYSTSKDYKKALKFYNKILKKDTTDTYINFQISGIYEKMENYPMAISGYEKLIKRDPDYIEAYVQLGKIYYEKLKNYSKAKRYLELANEKEIALYGSYPSNLDIYYYLGMIAVKEGRKLDAILAYMDLKSVYTYTAEDNEKKLKLYKAIKKLDN